MKHDNIIHFSAIEAFSFYDWRIPDKTKQLLIGIKSIFFERGIISIPILSPNYYWYDTITKAGLMIQVIEALKQNDDEAKIELFRRDYIKTLERYISDGMLRLGYLITVTKI